MPLSSWVPPVVGHHSPLGTPTTPTQHEHIDHCEKQRRRLVEEGHESPDLVLDRRLARAVQEVAQGVDKAAFVQGVVVKMGKPQQPARAARKVVDAFPLVSGDDQAASVEGAVVKTGTPQPAGPFGHESPDLVLDRRLARAVQEVAQGVERRLEERARGRGALVQQQLPAALKEVSAVAAQNVTDAFPLVAGDDRDEAAFVQGAVVKMGKPQQPARAAQKVVDAFPLVSGDDEAAFAQGAVVKTGTRKQSALPAGATSIGDRQVIDSAASTPGSIVSVADVVGKLKELVQLLDRNLISEQDFAIARKDLLEKGKSAQSLSKTQSPKGERGNASAAMSRPHAGAAKTRSPEQPTLWDDSAFSRTLVAAAAKLSALEQVADIRGSWQERPAPGGVLAAVRSADPRGSGSERMAEWNKLCHDQVQKASRAAIGSGVRAASIEPPLYAQPTPSVGVSVNQPAEYVKMYQSSNQMLGPLDFLTNTLNAVSPMG